MSYFIVVGEALSSSFNVGYSDFAHFLRISSLRADLLRAPEMIWISKEIYVEFLFTIFLLQYSLW